MTGGYWKLEGQVTHTGRIGLFIGLTLSLGLAMACREDKKSSPPPEPITQKADENQMNPQPRDKVKQGGKLVWPSMLPTNFNYGHLDGTVLDGAIMIGAVMPGLFTFDATGTPKYSPDYLVAEPTLVQTPKQVVTYRLNPKAIWYDGTPIVAADFTAQWKALNGTNPAFQTSTSTGYSQIESVVQGADKFEVVVTFKTPFAD
jgi:peptide/nickel transport system substrate-binding protein